MKRFFVLLLALFVTNVWAAPAPQTRGRAPVQTTAPSATVAARSATRTPATAARSAVPRTTVARSGAMPTAVSARSAQVSVAQKGTTVAAATQNTVVSPECREKYFGCMDSFCMLDNENGGRCQCSNRKAELDVVLADIEKLNSNAAKLISEGVEKIEMGAKADAVMSVANAAVKEVFEPAQPANQRRRLDLSSLNLGDDFIIDTSSIFDDPMAGDALADKKGDALHYAVADICVKRIPECAADKNMVQMMYTQNVRSDCAAYENHLRNGKRIAEENVRTAEAAVREAALTAYQTANKWDLGQCTVQFRNCMGEEEKCGEDFTGCVGIAAAENSRARIGVRSRVQEVAIPGALTRIMVSATTMEALESKRVMCETVLSQCQNVRADVWPAFLRDIAPTMKTAELLAESNLRTSCINNISECFLKACKDTIDPNDPEGSYDLCLTRPEALRSLCKVEIDPCVEATKTSDEQGDWDIMTFVTAKLAAMRTDSCTKAVRQCLQSTDRCGEDYTNCIGLDRMAIVDMCPTDRIRPSCSEGGTFDEDRVWDIVEGIFLNIDNNMLAKCQAVAETQMINICGDAFSCDVQFGRDKNFGAESLALNTVKADELEIIGLVDFNKITVEHNQVPTTNRLDFAMPTINFEGGMEGMFSELSNRNLESVKNKIQMVLAQLSDDPKLSMCIYGRDMRQIRGTREAAVDNMTTARFPRLLDSFARVIIDAGLKQAKSNYDVKFNSLMKEAMSKMTTIQNASKDISGGGMCYDKSIMGDLDFMTQ